MTAMRLGASPLSKLGIFSNDTRNSILTKGSFTLFIDKAYSTAAF
jgi:hypothetical protein